MGALLALAAPAAGDAIERLPLQRETGLGRPGAPAVVILVPDDAAYRRVGRELAAAIEKRTGIRLPVERAAGCVGERPRAVKPERLNRHFILLGQFWNNAVLERLYAGYYDPTDAFYPGPGGYALRTVCSPFRHGHHCIVVSGSDLEGCRKAVAALPGRIETEGGAVRLPFLHEVHLAGDVAQHEKQYRAYIDPKLAQIERYAVWGHSDPLLWTGENPRMERLYATRNLGAAGAFALRYWLARSPADGKACRVHLLDLVKNTDLVRRVQDAGQLYTEYDLGALLKGWDLVEETDLFTEGERAGITQFIFSLVEWNKTAWFIHQCKDTPLEDVDFGGRHIIAGTLHSAMAADYFLRNCRVSAQQAQWLRDIQAHAAQYLRRLGQSWFYSDGPSLLNDEGETVLRYALMTGDLAFAENGCLRALADYMVMHNDTLKRYATDGICGSGVVGALGGTFLNAAGYLYHENGYQWYRRSLGRFPYSNFTFYLGQWAGVGNVCFNWEMPPSDAGAEEMRRQATGISILPLADAFERNIRRFPDKWTGGFGRVAGRYHYDPVPPGETWKRICLRSGLGPGDQYLLLDGMQGVEWSFDDIQGIHFYNDLGRRLIKAQFDDATSATRLETNTLFASSGKPGQKQSLAARLLLSADLGPHGLVRSQVENHDGVAWTRSVFWLKDGFFLLADQVDPRAEGAHYLAQTWLSDLPLKPAGPATVVSASPEADCPVLHILTTPDRSIEPFRHDERDAGIRHTAMAGLSPGKPYTLWTLLTASGEKRPGVWAMARVARDAVLLTRSGPGAGEPQAVLAFLGALDLGGLRIEAEVGILEKGRVTLARCRHITAGGRTLLAASEGATFSWDLAGNTFEAGKDGYGLLRGEAPPGLAGRRSALRQAVGACLRAAAKAPAYLPPEAVGQAAEAERLPGVRTFSLRTPVSLAAADLEGNGSEELLLYREDGTPRFDYPAFQGEPAAVRFDGNGRPDIAFSVGKPGANLSVPGEYAVVVHRPDGSVRFRHPVNLLPTCLAAGDLDGDGREELDVGMYDWAVLLDHSGKRLFDAEVPGRKALARQFGKVGPDGSMEVVALGAVGMVSVHSPKHNWRTANWQSFIGTEQGRLWLLDLDGDGKLECYVGGGGTDPACYDLNPVQMRWAFGGIPIHPNDMALRTSDFGFRISDVAGAQAEIVCGGNDGFLYVLDAKGQFRFSASVGAAVTRLASMPGGRLAAGLQSGVVLLLDGKLQVLGQAKVGALPVEHLAVLRRQGAPPRVFAADHEGHAIAFEAP